MIRAEPCLARAPVNGPCRERTSAHINNRGHSTAANKQQQTNCLSDCKGLTGYSQRRANMAHTQAGPVMVQEAVPAAAPPTDEASLPAGAYSKTAENGNGAAAHPKTEDDSDSDTDVWDALIEAAEEDATLEGMLCAPEPHSPPCPPPSPPH